MSKLDPTGRPVVGALADLYMDDDGAHLGAFWIFREHIWRALYGIQDRGWGPPAVGLGARIAFCNMAVEAFGSYFTHHFFLKIVQWEVGLM